MLSEIKISDGTAIVIDDILSLDMFLTSVIKGKYFFISEESKNPDEEDRDLLYLTEVEFDASSEKDLLIQGNALFGKIECLIKEENIGDIKLIEDSVILYVILQKGGNYGSSSNKCVDL